MDGVASSVAPARRGSRLHAPSSRLATQTPRQKTPSDLFSHVLGFRPDRIGAHLRARCSSQLLTVIMLIVSILSVVPLVPKVIERPCNNQHEHN